MKHSAEPKQKIVSDKDRLAAYEDIKPLWKPTLTEVKENLNAVQPCNFCLSGTPKKTNGEGRCLMCDGKSVVPDRDRRWRAVLFIGDRHAPTPKAVEMRIDDNRDNEELLKQYDTPEKAAKALEALRKAEAIPLGVVGG